MQPENRKDNHLTYFRFFFGILRFHFFFAISLNIFIGLLDGIGITILFPLLQSVEGAASMKDSMGQLKYVISAFQYLNIPLTVNAVLAVFLILFILKGFVKYCTGVYQAKIQMTVIREIQSNFLKHIRNISYKGFLQMDAGIIQNALIAEVGRVSDAMRSYLKWSNSLFLLSTYVVLAYMANAEFALIISVGVGLINILYRSLSRKIKATSYEISKKGRKLNGFLIEIVHHFKYLKSTNTLFLYTSRLRNIMKERYTADYTVEKLSTILISLREPTVIIMVVGTMLIQVNYIGGGIGSIILSLLLFYRGLTHLMTLQTDWQNFMRNSGAFRMVTEVSATMKSHREDSGDLTFSTLKKNISLEGVALSFGKNKVLNDIHIKIPRNTTVALTGVSGSGKTTIVNIISGLLKPDKGRVVVDGLSLDEYNLESYRSKIGYISQEAVIFNESIFNNITLWAEPTEQNRKRFSEVIEMASLVEFIAQQEDQEHTQLGDNGLLISGGQRQRISIARELFKNPEILILDEATSALDSETEKIIQDNIEKLHGHYTMIIIAHRLSTIKHVDQIYLLEKGEVVNSGRFDQMLESSSKFKYLVSLQGL